MRPHGMEFLYDLNRFNVATSRARCACIVVGSPRLFSPECRTPRQMELANVLCRYAEMSTAIRFGTEAAVERPLKLVSLLLTDEAVQLLCAGNCAWWACADLKS